MFYLGVLLIFMGFSPVSQYVDDLLYVRNQPSYDYNEYYYEDDDQSDLFDFDSHDGQEHINTYKLNYVYGDDIYVDNNSSNMGSALFGLFFIGLGVYLVVKNWKKPHKRSTFWKVIGGLVCFVGVTRVLSDTLVISGFYFNSIPGRILVGLRYFIPGMLLIFYNRKEEYVQAVPVETIQEPVQVEEIPVKVVPNTPIERLITKLEEAQQTKYSLDHPELEENLDSSIKLLKEIHRSDYDIDDDFLEKVASLTDSYLEIDNLSYQNQRSQEVLNSIGNTYGVINEALENIYDSNFNEKANDIESEVVSFQTKLSLDGKLDSPFEKFMENYQNKEE